MKKYLSFAAFALLMSATTLSLSACGGGDDDDDADGTNGGADAAVLAGICPDSNHPHAIDMGDAGFWGCCNVGANKPEEYGSYFAWGDTEPKNDYSWDSYDYWTDSNGDGDVASTELADIGSDIGGNSAYDAATKKWGSIWRMPSFSQIEKLRSNCPFEWTQLNGINGWMFTAPNSNKIFMPAAGYRYYTAPRDLGSHGYYWTSSAVATFKWHAHYLDLLQDKTTPSSRYRFHGCTVRPVRR